MRSSKRVDPKFFKIAGSARTDEAKYKAPFPSYIRCDLMHNHQSIWFLLLPLCLDLSHVRTYDILPESFINQTRLCQINCTQHQTLSDRFTTIDGCAEGHFQICEGYLKIDFSSRSVSYGFDTADNLDQDTANTSALRADLGTKYMPYLRTNITAIRYRYLTMKFNEKNPHQLNIKYCKTHEGTYRRDHLRVLRRLSHSN